MGFLKYTVADLIGSGARVLVAEAGGGFTLPVTTGAPTVGLSDIITLEGPNYAPKTGWVDIGAAREGQGSNYERGIETQEWNIEQATGAVAEDVTDVPRSITFQMAEVKPAGVVILENAPGIRTITEASGKTAQKAVDFGSFESMDLFSVALLGMRRKGQGKDITEQSTTVRGGIVGVLLFAASIAAETASYELQKGQLANVPVQMRAFPHSSVTDSTRDRGTWLFEDGPETIPA